MEKLCETCGHREQCQTPCKAVKALLWKDNRVMERVFGNNCLSREREVHFSEAKNFDIEDVADTATVPWSSGDFRLRKTTVFVERFFNKVPCKDLAERFGVKENTIVCMYAQAVEDVQRIIEALDARKAGLKATKPDRFTEDQKYFLLVSVFGFSGTEVARMFNKNRNRVIWRSCDADRYQALFEEPDVKTSVYDDLNVEQIKERMAY